MVKCDLAVMAFRWYTTNLLFAKPVIDLEEAHKLVIINVIVGWHLETRTYLPAREDATDIHDEIILIDFEYSRTFQVLENVQTETHDKSPAAIPTYQVDISTRCGPRHAKVP